MNPTAYLVATACASVLAIFTIGCSSKSLTVQDFLGTYVVRYSHGTETLTLHADGGFDQVYLQTGHAESLTNTGKWRCDTNATEVLFLDHAMFVHDTFTKGMVLPPRYGSTILHTRVIAGVIELVVDSDGDIYYQKQPKARP